MFIDTHTHLFDGAFDEDRDQVIVKALACGIGKFLLPNIDIETVSAMHKLAEKYPKVCYAMMGLHPGSVDENWKTNLARIKEFLFKNKYVAVGEIGMDLYWDKTFVEEQKEVFRSQVEWAKELKLPIVIHAREAFMEIFEIVDELNSDDLRGVFHCFTGTVADANKIIAYGGFKMGIGGVLTYKNAKMDEVLDEIDLQHIILETDSPYLSPAPYRGKRNESSYLINVAEKLAEVYDLPLMEIEKITTKNANDLFDLST